MGYCTVCHKPRVKVSGKPDRRDVRKIYNLRIGLPSPLLGVSRKEIRQAVLFPCCIKDGSRPTAYAVQTGYANHLKVLWPKATVLNVQAKGVRKDIR
jgi:hypothetical protein